MKKLKNIHPGEILDKEFLQPMKLSQNQIAKDIGVPPRRINEIIHGNRGVTADTSIRLAKYFGLSDGFFLGLQKDYDLEESKKEIGNKIVGIKPCRNLAFV
jgi:addiction module HigA family antidote